MEIIKRNFFSLLRSGALNEHVTLEPMSNFKWKRLFQLLETQKVVSIAIKGIRNHQYNTNIQIPQQFIEDLSSKIEEETDLFYEKPSLSTPILNKRLQKIRNNEVHSIDTSTETLYLLDIIVYNINHILNNGISLRGILEIGRFLRTEGEKVDFVKLDTWLNKLHIQQIAQLQGSILIAVFNFERDEIPFVHQVERQAYNLALLTLTHNEIDTSKEWHFRQSKTGFVHNNNAMLRRNLKRSIRYIQYAPIETTSNFISNIVRGLAEIEE